MGHRGTNPLGNALVWTGIPILLLLCAGRVDAWCVKSRGLAPRHPLVAHEGPRVAAASRSRLIMRLNPQSSDVPIGERVFSMVPYVLPVLDGIMYGRYFLSYVPDLAEPLLEVLGPILSVYKSSPFVSLAVYLGAVYIGRRPDLSRFVRFNFQQAVLLDVALVLPSILVGFLQGAPDAIKEPINTTFFFVLCASVGYSLAALVRGNKPAGIPIISQAAEMTIGPF